MFQFSLPAEVGQSVSYPTRGGCAEGTATIMKPREINKPVL